MNPRSTHPLDPRFETLRPRVLEAVRSVEPGAEVILYGSRVRGDAATSSDWDLLILLDGELDESRKDAVCHRLYRLELELDELLSPLVFFRQDWDSPRFQVMPLHRNVEKEGIAL